MNRPQIAKTSSPIWLRSANYLAPLIALSSLTGAAPAAVISWGGATNVNGDADVSLTTSTLVRALDIGGSVNQTINGVTFVANSDTTTATYNVATGVGGFGAGNAAFTGYGNPVANDNSTLSTSYATALSSGMYVAGNGSIGNYTLTGLTQGQQYEIQIWFNDVRTSITGDTAPFQVYDSGAGTPTVTLTTDDDGLDGAGPRGALAQYVIGTFTADATGSQLFRVDENSGVGGATINLFQIRAIPEPSVSLLGGLGVLALLRRRRN